MSEPPLCHPLTEDHDWEDEDLPDAAAAPGSRSASTRSGRTDAPGELSMIAVPTPEDEKLRAALDRWVKARKFILTLNDQIGSAEFRAAWNELGEAEWALQALSGMEGGGGGDISAQSQPSADKGPQPCSPDAPRLLRKEDVEWVVNDIAELGVKIGNQFFFLYKGASLVYGEYGDERKDGIALHDEGEPMHWRPVFKREFGECAHPINYDDPKMIGTVALDDSDEWKELPAATGPSSDPGGPQ